MNVKNTPPSPKAREVNPDDCYEFGSGPIAPQENTSPRAKDAADLTERQREGCFDWADFDLG